MDSIRSFEPNKENLTKIGDFVPLAGSFLKGSKTISEWSRRNPLNLLRVFLAEFNDCTCRDLKGSKISITIVCECCASCKC